MVYKIRIKSGLYKNYWSVYGSRQCSFWWFLIYFFQVGRGLGGDTPGEPTQHTQNCQKGASSYSTGDYNNLLYSFKIFFIVQYKTFFTHFLLMYYTLLAQTQTNVLIYSKVEIQTYIFGKFT